MTIDTHDLNIKLLAKIADARVEFAHVTNMLFSKQEQVENMFNEMDGRRFLEHIEMVDRCLNMDEIHQMLEYREPTRKFGGPITEGKHGK